MSDMRSYYSLLSFRDGRWGVEFGDYSRRVVMNELRDTRERGVKYRVINTLSDQASINSAVRELNLVLA